MSSSISSLLVKKFIQQHGLAQFFALVEEAMIRASAEAMVNETKALYLKCAERINNLYRDSMKSLLGEK
jgi:hypothetical protein